MFQNFGTPEKRKLFRQHWQEFEAWRQDKDKFDREIYALFVAGAVFRSGYPQYKREIPPYPEEVRGLMCGAKTRKGTPCKQLILFTNGRCKFHGGASTGPKTKKGKARSARNGLQHKAEKRTP